MERLPLICTRHILDFILPVNDISKIDRESIKFISRKRVISKQTKKDINQLYVFDENYALLEPYFRQVSMDRNMGFELAHRFDLLIDLTKKARMQGKENMKRRAIRWNKMLYRIKNCKPCLFCDVLVHPESDYCDHCHTRIYINCLMCTIRVHQKCKSENKQLCDDCGLDYG